MSDSHCFTLICIHTHAILHGLTSIVNNHPGINDQTHHLHSRSIKNLPNMELHWHDNWLWTSCLACGGVSSSVWTGKGHHGEMKNQVVAFQTDPPGWWLMWNIHHTNVHINIYIHSYFTLSYTHIYIINYLNLYLSIQQYKNQYIYIYVSIKNTHILYIYTYMRLWLHIQCIYMKCTIAYVRKYGDGSKPL